MSLAGMVSTLEQFFLTKKGNKYVREILKGENTTIIDLDEIKAWDNTYVDIIVKSGSDGIGALGDALNRVVVSKKGLLQPLEIGLVGKCIPFVKIHETASEHIGKIVRVRGLVNRTQVIKPMCIEAVYKCRECGNTTSPIVQDSPYTISLPPPKCDACGDRVKYDIVEEMSKYVDSQEFTIQESHEDVSRRMPQRIKMLILKKLLINMVYCGDLVEIVGIVKLNQVYRRGKVSRFNVPYIEVLGIVKQSKDPESIIISPEDEERIVELSKKDDIYDILVENTAPSLYGLKKCKEACLLSLFGGITKEKPDITIRGSINVLIVGDPSTGKSQLLKSVAGLAPRGMFSTGRGVTGVGLTAALNKDKDSGEWVIDAGVLVLADKGIACIDEIDKMRDEDRTNIHEAMEQQTVSINKAGVNVTLMARTAVIAAGNPTFGRYDDTQSVFDNLKFPPSLFSRFDLIFSLIDKPDEERDIKVISCVSRDNCESIDRELFKKYIAYAKRLKPKISKDAKKVLEDYFLKMRNVMREEVNPEYIPISYRQFEALVRLTEARARVLLKEEADENDATTIIILFDEFLNDIKFDMIGLATGTPKTRMDKQALILQIIAKKQGKLGVPYRDIIDEAINLGIPEKDAERAFVELYNGGDITMQSMGRYRTTV